MVYGSPTTNLSALSGVEYDLKDSISSIWTVAEIHIGPLIFVSPTHVRLYISLNARSADIVNILQSGYNSTLTAITRNGDFKTSFISTGWAGSADYKQPQILNADFTTNTGDNRVDSIIVDSWVVMDGESIPGTSRADTNIVYPDGSKTPAQFFIEWIESAFVIVGKNANFLRRNKYNTQHACLPPNPVKGQTHRIKNGSYDSFGANVFIHAFDKQIDNQGVTLYLSQVYSGLANDENGNIISVSYPFTENGFMLPPLHACMLVYDGTKWLIQEYFNGARLAGTYDWWAYSPLPSSIPLITKPIVVCDTTTSNKLLQLPDPAGPLKVVRIIVIPAAIPTATALFIFPYTGTTMEDNRGNSFYMRPATNAANACMTLMSDGTQWWVANVYEGTNSFFTSQVIQRPLSFSPLTVIKTMGVDGVRLPPVSLPAGLALETFAKMDATSPYNGIVINTSNDTDILIGAGQTNCMFAGAPWKNYTAVSVIGLNNGANTVYFVTGYFSGY